jgi:hypothetical protein
MKHFVTFYRLNGNTSHFKSNMEDSDAICQWAYNAEKIIHGNPSGIRSSVQFFYENGLDCQAKCHEHMFLTLLPFS